MKAWALPGRVISPAVATAEGCTTLNDRVASSRVAFFKSEAALTRESTENAMPTARTAPMTSTAATRGEREPEGLAGDAAAGFAAGAGAWESSRGGVGERSANGGI